MAKTLNYNKAYFKKRDHLDLHIAQSLKLVVCKNNLKRILDVGCGTGKLVNFFQKEGFDAHGCDNQKEAILLASKINKKGTITKASAANLPYKNNSFELISAISIIEHLTQTEAGKLLDEAQRILKPKGYIFLITPNFNSPLRYLKRSRWFGFSDPTHITFFTPKTLSTLLVKHKFVNIKTRLRSAYNIPTNLHLPKQIHNLPIPLKNLLNYFMISSPLAVWRDSFWILAQKKS